MGHLTARNFVGQGAGMTTAVLPSFVAFRPRCEARWTLRRGDSQLASSYGICPDFENCIFEAHSSYDVLDNWQLQTARDCNQRGKATGQQPLSLVRIPSFPPGARVGGPGIAPRADPSDRLMRELTFWWWSCPTSFVAPLKASLRQQQDGRVPLQGRGLLPPPLDPP